MPHSLFNVLRGKTGLTIEQLSGEIGYSPRTIYRWESGETQPKQIVIQKLKEIVAERQNKTVSPSFDFIDLFAGIGGLRRGFEPLGGRCVFTSEWDQYAKQTYLANFDCDHEVAGDITKIPPKDIPSHDLLLAGFPCQPFSIAGVSKKNSLNRPHGFRCETQGTLFFNVEKIIEYHRPKVFLLENVKNLVNHDKGRTFETIYQVLTEQLGYHVSFRVIDAKSWVPQHRERIFIAGFRDHNNFTLDDLDIPDPLAGPKLGDILHGKDDATLPLYENNRKYLDRKGRVLEKYTLSDKLWAYLQAYAEKHRQKGNGFGCTIVGKGNVARTLSARYYKDGSEILVKQRGSKNPRRLTPRECSRLMGFDSLNGSEFKIPVSDTQAYKQFGNSVVVPVVEAVARHMAPWIIDESYPSIASFRQKGLFA